MKYDEWMTGLLRNEEWKKRFPNLWDDFVKDKHHLDRVEATIRSRIINLEQWWKDTDKDCSGEIHFLNELLEKLEFIGNMVLAQKISRLD